MELTEIFEGGKVQFCTAWVIHDISVGGSATPTISLVLSFTPQMRTPPEVVLEKPLIARAMATCSQSIVAPLIRTCTSTHNINTFGHIQFRNFSAASRRPPKGTKRELAPGLRQMTRS